MSPVPFFIDNMEQVSKQARIGLDEIINDRPTRVHIPGTRRYVALKGIKPYTLERLTRLWIERDVESIPDDAASTLKSMCREPYFAVKEAVILSLNSFWGLRLIYPFKWRIWAFLRGYTEGQMMPIIMEGKKKLPLTAHWTNMVYSSDMRTDWMRMTKVEAEQYRAELLLAQSQPSSKSSPNMDGQDGALGTGVIGAS